VQEILSAYPGPYVVIGDRKNDQECAKACKSPFIGCLYGYGEEGELEGADRYAESVEELPKLLESL
jgi:phosphoglycolate phosphatase